MNLNFRQLNAFVALARTSNFTRAAEQVHMTQAGLSLMLREMETQLNCRLFERTTRAVWLTPGGTRFLPFAERTLRDFADFSADLGKLSADAARTVTVAATPLVASTVLPAVCRDLAKQHPQIRILVKDVDRRSIQPLVEAGEVDVGVGILFKPGSTITRELLVRLPLVCVSARGSLAAKGGRHGTLTWGTLRKVPLLALPSDNAIQQLVDANLGAEHVAVGRPTFSNLHTLVAMAEAGRGAAILPAFVAMACKRYQVDVQRVDSPRVSTEFFAIAKKGLTPSAAVKPFLEELKVQLSNAL